MSKISFQDIGAVVATCLVEEGVTAGMVVKLTGSGKVGPCADGDKFCGVALAPRKGAAGVYFKGFAAVQYTGELSVGWATLAADGTGGVKSAETGVPVRVVQVEENGTAMICL